MTLIIELFFFDFSVKNKIITIALMSGCMLIPIYYWALPIRRKLSLSKLKSSDKNKIKKNHYVIDGLVFPLIYALHSSCMLILIFQDTLLINANIEKIEGFLKLIPYILLLHSPSFFIYTYNNLKGIILGVISAYIVIVEILYANASPTSYWLTKNHIANFYDQNYVFKNDICGSLKTQKIPLNELENGDCTMSAPFKVVSTSG